MGKKKTTATAQIDALIAKAGGNKQGKKSRKWGWYKRSASCMRYKGEQRWVVNKVRRMNRHLRQHPNDGQARSILGSLD